MSEPFSPGAVKVTLGLGKVERQIVGAQTVMNADLGKRNLW